ncbi:TIGR02221 family CRISPR-associated protein [Rhodothermus profundi]|uniref:CRISPR-associated protein, Csx2 family n=1 Tax=Rhodothermus profundi TaxID=633813 RepID=A0A1M6V4C8_9BACT|nr:TIGR02221 family CRISPR-associated protein [Rhodothermus profundi]SHK76225.1 CRISPR-associated protein, Csx2 family [Rhodothermus profundi]
MASLKALTFLGTGPYKTVTYIWHDGQKCQTHLFPEAVARIFRPEKILVFVTPQARAREHFQSLKERMGNKLQPENIPEGRSEAELWQIFDCVASSVDEGDTVILDITHAFRSIPMIVFAVAAYLRRTKGVTIRHIVYGAYEAREPFREPPQPEDRAPIFDLTLLLDLLDWLSGTEFMLQRSDATLLAERLESVHQQAWKTRAGDDLPRRLQGVAKQLRSFSQALHLARPRNVMDKAARLLPVLQEVASEAERWAKPFAVILEQIHAEIAPFAHDAPDRLDRENLQKQLALIEHLVKKGLWMQAVTLAREWVVSWVVLQKGDGDWLDKNYREQQIERVLGAAVRKLQQEKTEEVPAWFDSLPEREQVVQVWDWLLQLRNDVAHCGMRQRAASIQSIARRTKEIPKRLEVLMHNAPDHVLCGGRVEIDLKSLYGEVAKLEELSVYLEQAKTLAGEGNEVVLTGQAPVWLYLAVAHALHGKVRRLVYASPVTGEVCIFDHSPE